MSLRKKAARLGVSANHPFSQPAGNRRSISCGSPRQRIEEEIISGGVSMAVKMANVSAWHDSLLWRRAASFLQLMSEMQRK